MSEFRETFWTVACEFDFVWGLMFALNVVFLVMLGFVALIVEPGTGSYYVTILSAALGLPLAIATGYMVRKCG
ncbi:hypothetical protein [Halomicrococcus sp. NG-SE-24]|uniref:hypothetical protein n=1 Tax=Halomicrococcus sp. NG-SE-24 TaxID=3436928 RepID=UPI003D98F3A1